MRARLYTGLLLVRLLTVAALAQVQDFTYTTNNGTITVAGYTGAGGAVTIPTSVYGLPITGIGSQAFSYHTNVTSVTIPDSVTSIDNYAFKYCSNLAGVYFQGNAPSLGSSVFEGVSQATTYFLPGTTGWGATFGGIPTALWHLPYPLMLTGNPSFGVRSNIFGFTVSWATNASFGVESATDLNRPNWARLAGKSLNNGTFYFTDPQWANYPVRFYRIRSP